MASTLKREFDYYLENQNRLLEKYNGKYVVIKNRSIIGSFDDEPTAVTETAKNHELGTFLVQKVEPGEAGYTQIFHSRVVFS